MMSDLASAWDAASHEMVVLQYSFVRFAQLIGIRYFGDVSSDLKTPSRNIEILNSIIVCRFSLLLHLLSDLLLSNEHLDAMLFELTLTFLGWPSLQMTGSGDLD